MMIAYFYLCFKNFYMEDSRNGINLKVKVVLPILLKSTIKYRLNIVLIVIILLQDVVFVYNK